VSSAAYLACSHPSSSRSISSTSRLLKDKRWVNSADKEKKAEEEEEEGDESTAKKDKETDNDKVDNSKKDKDADKDVTKDAEHKLQAEAKAKVRSANGSSSAAGSSASGSGSGASTPPPPPASPGGSAIAKTSVPEVYPQVLALPITRRPLFPGFYKAVTITSPAVIKAVRELIAHGQPYIGAFLLKDSESDSDVITSLDQVHPVGVFAQITSVFSSADASRQPDTEDTEPRPETLTAVLYPHRRVRIDELVAAPQAPAAPEADAAAAEPAPATDAAPAAKAEADVPSFESEVPTIEETREALEAEDSAAAAKADAADPDAPAPSPIGFLHHLVPEISLTNVSNLEMEPHKKDSQVVRAIMGEILAVFKEIAQLQPIFREQSEFESTTFQNLPLTLQSRRSQCPTLPPTSLTSPTSWPTLPPLCLLATCTTSRLSSSRSTSRTACRRRS
jgi:Lon-like ATP-dependent protease